MGVAQYVGQDKKYFVPSKVELAELEWLYPPGWVEYHWSGSLLPDEALTPVTLMSVRVRTTLTQQTGTLLILVVLQQKCPQLFDDVHVLCATYQYMVVYNLLMVLLSCSACYIFKARSLLRAATVTVVFPGDRWQSQTHHVTKLNDSKVSSIRGL